MATVSMTTLFITLYGLGLVAVVHGLQTISRSAEVDEVAEVKKGWPRILAIYVNMDSSTSRRDCASSQLETAKKAAEQRGMVFDYERFSAVTFSTCVDGPSCLKERPECFPSGRLGLIHHGLKTIHGAGVASMFRGVLGNWCSHLQIVEKVARGSHYDYYLLLEDDFILMDGFLPSLTSLIETVPHHWGLVAFDTFRGGGRAGESTHFPLADKFGSDIDLPLYSISATTNSYWGAHAWLINNFHINRFLTWFKSVPGVPLDWLPKANHPLHLGLWAYQPGTILQRMSLTDKEANSTLKSLDESCRDDGNGVSVIASGIKSAGQSLQKTTRSLPDLPSPQDDLWRMLEGGIFHESKEQFEMGGELPMMGSTSPKITEPVGLHKIRRHVEDYQVSHDMMMETANRSGKHQSEHKAVAVFGMYDSGSRYLENLIEMNLDNPISRDIWGHTHPDRIMCHRDVANANCPNTTGMADVVAVVVVRHPYSVIAGLQTATEEDFPELHFTVDDSTGNIVWNSTCKLNEKAEGYDDASKVKRAPCQVMNSGGSCWRNLAQMYNSYAQGYIRMSSAGIFSRVVFVRYEDVVEAPKEALARIAGATGTILKNVSNIRLSETEEEQAWLDNELETLHQQTFFSEFSCGQVYDMCNDLDHGLFFRYGYHACQVRWPGFDFLINEGDQYQNNMTKMQQVGRLKEHLHCYHPAPTANNSALKEGNSGTGKKEKRKTRVWHRNAPRDFI